MPGIVKVPLVPAASAHVPPLFASVTTTVALEPRLDRLQLLKPPVAYVFAAALVTPEIVNDVCVLAGSEQDPAEPLSASVTVTVGPAVVAPVALQPVNPAPSTIVGVAVTANAALKAEVIVEPA